LILVASLIDKVPNLAGLTRTCEIMNVKGLVIGNRQVVKTDEFKTIAVTAEKWLPIYEVQER
jgi:tRNA guanosine-2'-O-methyltransferase